jgi:hypothetical protein
MRLVYLDEAGTGSPLVEPYLVIAGVIINADQDWRPLQRHIKALRRKYLPSEDQDNFIFHATDVSNGTGYFKKDRYKWPRDKRIPILRDLSDIPRRFHLPIVQQAVPRGPAAKWFQAKHQRRQPKRAAWDPPWGNLRRPELADSTVADLIYASAWVWCIEQVDRWMKAYAPNEVAMIVAEQSGKIENALKAMHKVYAGDESYNPRVFSTERIVDTITFAGKSESILLQIADTCAFVIKRKLSGKDDVQPYFVQLEPQLTSSLEILPWAS